MIDKRRDREGYLFALGATTSSSSVRPGTMKFTFDAELRGANGISLPVHCEVQPPHIGGQKALIRVAIPAQYIVKKPPSNPCVLSGQCGAFNISMLGIYWRSFPTSSQSTLGLETIELLHIDELSVAHSSVGAKRELRFHIAPTSYLRSEANCVHLGDKSCLEELFALDLPDIGATSFVAEWITTYHRDAETPSATVTSGFTAIAGLPPDGPLDIARLVSQFKDSLVVLSVLFRQAISLHGWTHADVETVSTWICPLDPNVTPSARADRGDFVARPQVFVECATSTAQEYGKADEKIRSLVRHLSLAINPHNNLRDADHFLLMFSALERVVESAWKHDRSPRRQTATTKAVIGHLEQMQNAVSAEGGESASEISARLGGLIKVVNRISFRDKLEAFFRAYPTMANYCTDLWPILGSEKKRGLRDIRHALAHGHSSFASLDVVAVAGWHLAILLERAIFLLLDMTPPDGISPNSLLLRTGARGWYEKDRWVPLMSKPDQSI